MSESPESPPLEREWEIDSFPDEFAAGSTVLIASAVDPTQYAIDLHALCKFGEADDTALIVTTTEGAIETLERYEQLCPASDRPSLGFVDTTATQPSAPALYRDTSTVFIPSPGDLERLVIGLSDVSENTPPADAARHLVIRSLTPILEVTPTEQVCNVLSRVMGLRAKSGLCVLGIDFTAHDEETIRTVAEQVDGILWVTESSSETLELAYEPIEDRHLRRSIRTPE